MGKWNYAELSAVAGRSGGTKAYALPIYDFQKGILLMLPICIGGCIFSHKKGMKAVSGIKDRVHIITKKEVPTAKQELVTEIAPAVECCECGKKASGVDEITVLFGYRITKDKNIIPHTLCKACRQKGIRSLWYEE